ncbi:hypothetical protein J6590_084070 [Homalodisca vitripennis]|nr:hypothetical protein J6590_084070 [Homalodisca vitripennis]
MPAVSLPESTEEKAVLRKSFIATVKGYESESATLLTMDGDISNTSEEELALRPLVTLNTSLYEAGAKKMLDELGELGNPESVDVILL